MTKGLGHDNLMRPSDKHRVMPTELPSQRVNLAQIALYQLMARNKVLPPHRNYLLTSYDLTTGEYIPLGHGEKAPAFDQALSEAEGVRKELFPDTSTLYNNVRTPSDSAAQTLSLVSLEQAGVLLNGSQPNAPVQRDIAS